MDSGSFIGFRSCSPCQRKRREYKRRRDPHPAVYHARHGNVSSNFLRLGWSANRLLVAGSALMIEERIAELDRKLNETWFDGVVAVVAAAALTASLRFLVEWL
jgi:hypothetical protein